MNSVDSDLIESEGSSHPKTTARVVRQSLLCVAIAEPDHSAG